MDRHGDDMIYLDNNATTSISPEVLEVMNQVAVDAFGNPGSRHQAGRAARKVLENSRETIAEILNTLPDEIVFTSGGTEASNLAVLGLTRGRTSGTILLPAGEHPATEESTKRQALQGLSREILLLDHLGRIQFDRLQDLDPKPIVLATALLAHNETGTIQDLTPLSNYCQQHRIPFHVDAVQAIGKIPIDFQQLGSTTLALAAHKFHGPRGIGALLVRKGTRLQPILVGGHQERGLRSGTECVVLAAGMAHALKIWREHQVARAKKVSELRDELQAGLIQRCPDAVINGDIQHRLPNTLNISFPGCNADALLVALDLAGVCCSHGSACASGSSEPAPVLVAMGCSEDVQKSAIRLSLSHLNTREEITQAIEIIADTVERIREMSR